MAHSRGTQPNLLEWLKKDSLDEGQLGPQVLKAGVSQARGHGGHSLKNFLFKDSYLLLYLAVSGLNCGMQDLVPRPGTQSWAPCIGSMEPQLLDHQRSPMKTFQHGKQVSANVTQDLSLLAAGLRTCMSILPKGPRWEGGPKAFPSKPFVQGPLPGGTQPRTAFSAICLDFILPFLFPLNHIHSLQGSASGTMGPFPPASCLPSPFTSFWSREGPGDPQGARDQSTVQELAGTQPLRAVGTS